MFHHCLFLSLCLSTFLFQISNIHCTSNRLIQETDDRQRTQMTLLYLIKNLLDESNPSEQTKVLNELREHLNRMCTAGHLGTTHAHACQRILDIVQSYEQLPTDDSNTEQHDLQKRFFCNGFIGCRNAGR
ncbi:unnamed protein product [Adineta ricciae]|uniref:Uncharacterized protein n=2 Tax=Adineta ricciae TaxID=249248 RepID=A0A813QWY1_ADIRI|nr:unnamed protein product [Adineta ricciae]